jgi:phage-related holin
VEVFNQIGKHFIHLMTRVRDFSITTWLMVFLIGMSNFYLSLIGYPKQAIKFIIILVVCDFITRVSAEIIHAGGLISAFRTKRISSRKFFTGFFTKVISYSVILIIAHQASITEELIFRDFVSNTLYGGLIIYDIISNLENLTEAGFRQAGSLLKIFKKKYKEIGLEEQVK